MAATEGRVANGSGTAAAVPPVHLSKSVFFLSAVLILVLV